MNGVLLSERFQAQIVNEFQYELLFSSVIKGMSSAFSINDIGWETKILGTTKV